MSRRTSRPVRVLAAAAVATALLGACAEELPQPRPEPTAATAAPVLDAERMDRVLQEVAATITAADEARDPDALAPRVTGPAQQVRQAEYRLVEATGGAATPVPLTTASQVQAVAATTDFPRVAMAVTEVPEGANLPLLLALTQPTAREPFALWGFVELFPGVETPALVSPDRGSEQLPPDAEGLVLSPEQAVQRWVEAFNDPDGEAAAQFGADPFTTTARERTATLDTQVESAGEATISAAAGDTAPLSLRTADGGALVMAEVTTSQTLRKTVAGSTFNVGGAIGALLGEDKEVRGTVTATTASIIAFYVPPADAEDPTIDVLGATTVTDGVSRDDAAAPAES